MEKRTYDAHEVAQQLGTSKAYAYKLIRRLNGELEAAGRITVPGKVSVAYFESRVFGTDAAEEGRSHVG